MNRSTGWRSTKDGLILFVTRQKATLVDISAWFISIPISILLRFDGVWPQISLWPIIQLLLVGASLNLLLLQILKINSARYSLGSIDQTVSLSIALAIITISLTTLKLVTGFPALPRSIPFLACLITLLLQLFFRFSIRTLSMHASLSSDSAKRTLIYGAGIAGKQIAEHLLQLKNEFRLVGFIDDNKIKVSSRILGEKVIGTSSNLESFFQDLNPDLLIIAIADLESDKLKSISKIASKNNVEVRILPSARKIISGEVTVRDARQLKDSDFLGRKELERLSENASEFYLDKTVLITGAGGSIGSEIARQLQDIGCQKIFLLDRDENSLLRILLDLDITASLASEFAFLADIREAENLNRIVSQVKPEIVFHSAALKHVSSLERFPDEAWKTNYHGTANVLNAAIKYEVPFFVNISSDKAANPSTVLGESKLAAEKLIANSNKDRVHHRRYISVRFGNVIGSNGSFVHIFRKQIEVGGPLTVRHPEATRYFMSVKEAVKLVLESALIGEDGETLILDMGDPVKILDVATQMIEASGRDIEIKITGLNPGEKIHEVLVGQQEQVYVKNNPRIFHTRALTE